MNKAIILTVESVRTRASTSEALITFALPLENATQVSKFMGMIGEQVGAAFVEMKPISKDTFGQEAATLRRSAFFRTPEVWKAVGSDEQFLDWLRGQPCAYCNDYDYLDDGRKVCEAAHVRRVKDGAGTSIKPPYSAISLCNKHHQLQHIKGERALGDKDWYQKKRISALVTWCWQFLKHQLGYKHWSEVPPDVLKAWAHEHRVYDYLPREYKTHG